MFGVSFSRGTSCGGGSLTRSTSPEIERRDARRVGDDRQIDDSVDVALEQAVLDAPPVRILRSTVRTSGSRDFSTYGPVPLAARAVIMSSFCV